MLKIALIEPFFSGSHQSWAEGLAKHSRHEIKIFSLPGRHWKWRMHGGAVSLAKQFNASDFQPDLILATDMLDVSSFLGLTRKKTSGIPLAVYFHENQLTYPWSPTDQDTKLKRDNHYSFINFTSALAADQVFFNSGYHLNSFLDSLPGFLQQFPDHQETHSVDIIRAKSQVLSLGMDLKELDISPPPVPSEKPLILWNHRWEYDKNPEAFFKVLLELKAEGYDYELAVVGENYRSSPKIFAQAKEQLSDRMVQFGYAESKAEYIQWLWKADILPVTSVQDFFGGSVVEAMYCNCYPLLPNRLAYPGHIPDKLKAAHLYEDEADLKRKLIELLIHKVSTKHQDISQLVSNYDWQQIIPTYDQAFEQILE